MGVPNHPFILLGSSMEPSSWGSPMANPGALGRCAGCRRGLADGGERAGVAAGGTSTVERCRNRWR